MHDLTIVFDLDGTLVDTAPDLVSATNHVMAKAGLPPVAAHVLRSSIGHGARRMIAEGAKNSGHALANSEIDRMLDQFLIHYASNIAAASRPFPGAIAALDDLQQAGARLTVCTNKRYDLAVRLLRELGLADRFSVIAGRDTYDVCKPHPGHLLKTIAEAGGRPDRAVMIGDSSVDIETAQAANVPVVAVTFGYSDKPVERMQPDAIIHHFDELGPAVRRLLALPLAT